MDTARTHHELLYRTFIGNSDHRDWPTSLHSGRSMLDRRNHPEKAIGITVCAGRKEELALATKDQPPQPISTDEQIPIRVRERAQKIARRIESVDVPVAHWIGIIEVTGWSSVPPCCLALT